jgi:hypothetical protein
MKKEDHPVGFKKYILVSVAGYRVRLHVWPTGEGNDSRHNHRWWFISIPIIGKFVETRYSEVSGSSYVKIDVADEHRVRDSNRRYLAKGESALDVLARKVRRPPVPYVCPIGAIHSLVPHGDGLHVSLIFCGRLRLETSEIWRHPDNIDVQLDEGGTGPEQ